MSRRSQAMVVVGDAKSSNTGRLAMICREYCDRVALVDDASELEPAFSPVSLMLESRLVRPHRRGL